MYDIDDPRYSGDQDLDSDAVDRSRINADPLSAGLGWFSIALGLAEPAAPRLMARQIGVPDTPWARTAFRQMGTRETGHGVALLMLPSRSAALQARVSSRGRRPDSIADGPLRERCHSSR